MRREMKKAVIACDYLSDQGQQLDKITGETMEKKEAEVLKGMSFWRCGSRRKDIWAEVLF
jgi:hypothetical protein